MSMNFMKLKKLFALALLTLVAVPVFAAQAQGDEQKGFKVDLSLGAAAPYHLIEEAGSGSIFQNLNPAAQLSIESAGESFAPNRLSATFMPNRLMFWEGCDYLLDATLEFRLLSMGGLKLFAGGGVQYDSTKKTETNQTRDCLAGIMSAELVMNMSLGSDLVLFTHIPFDQAKAYVDYKRGETVDTSALPPAYVGAMLSFNLM